MKTPEESKRNDLRDLFQSILRDNVISLSPVSVSAKEVFDNKESEVSFAFNERISDVASTSTGTGDEKCGNEIFWMPPSI